MRPVKIHRLLLITFLAAIIASCGGGRSSSPTSQWGSSLEQIRTAVAAAGKYPLEAVEVTASPSLLRITVSDLSLAQADQLTRENSANSIVSAAESVISQQPIFASVQAINIAIMHPERVDGSPTQTHTEDVLEFRKGPNNRFAHHIT